MSSRQASTTTPLKLPLHRLPLPKTTLQSFLPQLPLDDQPSSQRRSTSFKPATSGVWARVNPLWAPWPLRVTKDELRQMGVDIDNGGQVSVEDVLARWDPTEGSLIEDGDDPASGETHPLQLFSSQTRMKIEPVLLGLSPAALKESLPHLDAGDAEAICNASATPSSDSAISASRDALLDILSGRRVLASKAAPVFKSDEEKPSSNGDVTPIAPGFGPWSTRYCGHQFGVWAGQLGDGRAISVMETESPKGGRQEIQLKGAGRTPFSRSADGLAVLRSGVREFLGCEAVAALGIPTTRSLALLSTSDLPVIREEGPEPPSLLARLAPSFIRIGHFEALNPGEAGRNMRQLFLGGGWLTQDDPVDETDPLGGQGSLEGLGKLVMWCKNELYGMKDKTTGEWVREVAKRNAEMVGMWQVYGYCHGVLNTDNISILGLTIDYGPYAFMDVFDEAHICNHSDPTGLYSYRNQPSRVLFALDKLVGALAPVIGHEELQGGVPISDGWHEGATKDKVEKWEEKTREVMKGWEDEFWEVERKTERAGWLKRFGIKVPRGSDDRDVIFDYLVLLHDNSMDLNASLRALSSLLPTRASDASYLDGFLDELLTASIASPKPDELSRAKEACKAWLTRYASRASEEQEIKAWEEEVVDTSTEAVQKFADTAAKVDAEGNAWEGKRRTVMARTNPRFVLRQWVLEELIAELTALGVGDTAGEEEYAEARRRLARVLDMSNRPFYPWGEGPDADKDDARLCGLGSQDMLGFQCSCSS